MFAIKLLLDLPTTISLVYGLLHGVRNAIGIEDGHTINITCSTTYSLNQRTS